jgi:dihydroorotate dehydrogenase
MRTYRIDRSYDWNYEHGPSYPGPFPKVPPTPLKDFFGIPVRSRLGIAAGLLLNARWIDTYARLGFDILTYKTVRSLHRACHPLPNWVYLDPSATVDPQRAGQSFRTVAAAPRGGRVFSSVSFGMPSKAPAVWMKDVARARRRLKPGQALIVSVVASPGAGAGIQEMIDDFANLTAMAREAGAQMIEANLSCPNVLTPEAQIFQDAELSGAIARAMRKAALGRPVALKVGYLPDDGRLRRLLRAVDGAADALTMVNGFSRPIVDRRGRAAFGQGREAAGILGDRIREPCVDIVGRAVRHIDRDRLGLRVIAVGGVFAPADAALYFDAGAAAVMMGSAPMFDPMLAIRMKAAHPEW